jgi:hypothetical protein
MKLFLQIAGGVAAIGFAILAVVCACYTFGNGYNAVSDPNVGDAVVSGAFGTGTLLTGGFAAFLAYVSGIFGLIKSLLSKVMQPATPGTPGEIGNVIDLFKNTDVQEFVAALIVWAKAPKDWAAIRDVVVQGIEALFVIGERFITNPLWRTKCEELLALFKAEFDAAVPKALDGTPKL